MTLAPRVNVLLSPHQNAFFAELADVLVFELIASGVEARLLSEPETVEPTAADVFVMLPPHEWVAIEGDAWLRDPAVAARTIGLGAEQPNSGFFRRNAEIGRGLGRLFDFSARTVDAFLVAGVDAAHLPFGYTARWDRFADDGNTTGPDVVFLGNFKNRRLDALARMSTTLGRHRTHLVLGDNTAPNTASSRWFVAGDDKRSLLATSKVLLNIHQSTEPYFEWLRFTEAALCGTVMLSEPATHSEPYVAGEHFVQATLATMADELERLLTDDEHRHHVRRAAYDAVAASPFAAHLHRLVDVASSLTDRRVPAVLPARTRRAALPHRNATAAAPQPPARSRTALQAAEVGVEIVAVGDITVDAPSSTRAGAVTVTRVADRAAGLQAMRASGATAVALLARSAVVGPATLESMQHALHDGADVVGAMVADAVGRRWTMRGLWQPTVDHTMADSFEHGWFLTRPANVSPDGRIGWSAAAVAHVPAPAVVTTTPSRSGVVIVLATYNPSPGLFHRQVRSIRAQTHDDFVCVVADDCSEPSSRAFIRRVVERDPRFVFLEHSENVGFYRNFERGITAALRYSPEFVALSDQDDIWFPDKVERAISVLRSSGAAMVYTDVAPVTDDRRMISPTFFGHRRPVTDSVLDLSLMNCAIGATTMVRSSLLDTALPFPPEGYRSFHDHWLARCAQRIGALTFDPVASMEYVQHGANVQGSRSARISLRDFAGVFRQTPTDEWDLDTALLRRRLHEFDVLEQRYGPSTAHDRVKRLHRRCLEGRRLALMGLIVRWFVDQRLRPRSRRENVEIRYIRAALVARRTARTGGTAHGD